MAISSLSSIFGNNLLVGEKALDYLWEKESVTSENIANVDTPGYKAKYVDFEDTFRAKLQAASGSREAVRDATKSSVWQVKESDPDTARLDENGVVLDTEQAELTRAAIQYQYEIQAVKSDVSRLSSVIKG